MFFFVGDVSQQVLMLVVTTLVVGRLAREGVAGVITGGTGVESTACSRICVQLRGFRAAQRIFSHYVWSGPDITSAIDYTCLNLSLQPRHRITPCVKLPPSGLDMNPP